MIALVVSMHAAVTYSHLGSWLFYGRPKTGNRSDGGFRLLSGLPSSVFHGLLFLIAGYFVPGAFDRKGFPLLSATAQCASDAFALLHVGHSADNGYWLFARFADHSRPALSQAYLPYLSSGRFLGGSGPMWFALALLCSARIYGLARLVSDRALRMSPRRNCRPIPRL